MAHSRLNVNFAGVFAFRPYELGNVAVLMLYERQPHCNTPSSPDFEGASLLSQLMPLLYVHFYRLQAVQSVSAFPFL